MTFVTFGAFLSSGADTLALLPCRVRFGLLESAPAQSHGINPEENPMMKNLISACLLSFGLLAGHAAFAADAKATCETQASEKKLAGAAKNSFVKKCVKDAGGAAAMASPACEKSAADKKLAGAAKTSHLKKCMADEKAGAKPAAAAAPATAAKPAAAATPAAPVATAASGAKK